MMKNPETCKLFWPVNLFLIINYEQKPKGTPEKTRDPMNWHASSVLRDTSTPQPMLLVTEPSLWKE